MVGIIGIVTALMALGLSLVITRIATTALTMTGLSYEAARFQARSAFTGTGFTSSESEKVVNHPVRRRIIMVLMIMRSAGLVTIFASLILTFAGTGETSSKLFRLLWLAGGVVALWGISRSKLVDRYLGRLIRWALKKWTDLDVRDYAALLKLSGEYTVMEIQVRPGDWVVGKALEKCKLLDEGITVLGITRVDGSYVGAAKGDTEMYAGDTLIIYGRAEALRELDQRRGGADGDLAHEQAVGRQRGHVAKQDIEEKERKKQSQDG